MTKLAMLSISLVFIITGCNPSNSTSPSFNSVSNNTAKASNAARDISNTVRDVRSTKYYLDDILKGF